MAILTHVVATSVSAKKLPVADMIAFINELLDARICSFPAAILVGQAQTLPYYWGDANDTYITPNAPGFMLDVDSKDFPQELIWYYGADQVSFQAAFLQIPFEEKDYCISFPHEWNGWDGAVIYAFEQPFLLDLQGSGDVTIHRYVTSCFILFSTVGGGRTVRDTRLQTILTSYFGPDLFIEEVIA